MDPSNALREVVPEEPIVPTKPAAVLKGTARGLEAFVDGGAPLDAIITALTTRLEEAPNFFRGNALRVRVEGGPLPAGSLSRLDDLASRFDLRIVEISPAKKLQDADAVPRPSLASGSAPSPATPAVTPATADTFDDESPTLGIPTLAAQAGAVAAPTPDAPSPDAPSAPPTVLAEAELSDLIHLLEQPSGPAAAAAFAEEPTQTVAPRTLAPSPEIELETITSGPRLVVGPVRSGVILEHAGHLIVFGDVNPGAEVRAEGNIVVLGRLRGTAHAGIGQDVGFILSLRLEPQQLRIGRKVARAADSDTPSTDAEIAYCTGDAIVVERYQGKLPRNLATSI